MECVEHGAESIATRQSLGAGRLDGQRCEIIHCGRGADDPLMVLGPRLQPVRHLVRRRLEFRHLQREQPLPFAVEDPDVWPMELVGGAGQEVATPGLNVDQLMGAKCTASTNVSASASWAMATARGTSLIVPSAFDAAPMASSRQR